MECPCLHDPWRGGGSRFRRGVARSDRALSVARPSKADRLYGALASERFDRPQLAAVRSAARSTLCAADSTSLGATMIQILLMSPWRRPRADRAWSSATTTVSFVPSSPGRPPSTPYCGILRPSASPARRGWSATATTDTATKSSPTSRARCATRTPGAMTPSGRSAGCSAAARPTRASSSGGSVWQRWCSTARPRLGRLALRHRAVALVARDGGRSRSSTGPGLATDLAG